MGQQQLLLLVLGIVIVGIAVVAGIQAFSEGKGKAQQDAAVSDAMRIISDTQAWKLKPTAFGGGAGTAATNFTGVSLRGLGYPVTSTAATTPYKTANGCYKLAGNATNATLTVFADTAGQCTSQISTVTITGANSNNIAWAYN